MKLWQLYSRRRLVTKLRNIYFYFDTSSHRTILHLICFAFLTDILSNYATIALIGDLLFDVERSDSFRESTSIFGNIYPVILHRELAVIHLMNS